MKKILILCLIIISSNSLWSQKIYEIDSIISFKIPDEDIKIDSLKNGMIQIQFHSKIGNAEYLAKKELFENDSINSFDSELPYDSKGLEKFYKTLGTKYVKSTNLKLEYKELIEKNNFKGFHLKFTDTKNNSIYEIEYFLLNKNIYTFSYRNTTEYDKDDSYKYFNSIKIISDKNIYQFSGKSPIEKSAYNLGYKIGYTAAKHPSYIWIAGGLILFLVIGIIVYFIRKK